MKKIIEIIFNIIKIILIIALLFEAVFLGLCVIDKTVDNSFLLKKGSYAVNPIWLADGKDAPIDEIYAGLDDKNAVEKTYDIYRYVCTKLMLTKVYCTRAKSMIHAWVGDSYENASISADVSNNTSHQYEIAGVPTLNANQKLYHSYTNSVYLTGTNDESLTKVLSGIIQFGNRYYSDGSKTYIQKGQLSVIEDGDEIFDWKEDFAEDKATAVRTYKDSDIRDLDNFIVSKETIIPESCTIRRVYSDEYSMYKYTVNFSLDCISTDENSATYYEVSSIKDLLGGFMKSLRYDRLDIKLELYSNGYLLSRNLVQNWTITVNLFNLSGHAESELTEVYNYRQSECKIVNFTEKA